MKRHLPSTIECLELLALALMVGGLQWSLQSWGWTALFATGFVWNWAVLNGWVLNRTQEKRYRFSVLRAITLIHSTLLRPFGRFPRLQSWAAILPAGLFFGTLAYLFEATIPWWSALLGSLAFLLIRRELRSRHESVAARSSQP